MNCNAMEDCGQRPSRYLPAERESVTLVALDAAGDEQVDVAIDCCTALAATHGRDIGRAGAAELAAGLCVPKTTSMSGGRGVFVKDAAVWPTLATLGR